MKADLYRTSHKRYSTSLIASLALSVMRHLVAVFIESLAVVDTAFVIHLRCRWRLQFEWNLKVIGASRFRREILACDKA